MVTIDYGNTNIIHVPQSYLVLVTGTLYSMDTDAFRLALKVLGESEEGIVFPDTNEHRGTITVAGVTYARSIQILAPYSVEFEDGIYSVRLEGSNNDIFDVEAGKLVQNSVQVIPTNSAGLVVVNNGGGGSGDEVWTETEKDKIIQDVEDTKRQATNAAMNSQTVKQI